MSSLSARTMVGANSIHFPWKVLLAAVAGLFLLPGAGPPKVSAGISE